MSDVAVREAEDVDQPWGRVRRWLEQNDPGVFAGLGSPGSPIAISDAEERMGLTLPSQMRRWLLTNDIDAGRQPAVDSCLVALGCAGVIPSGGLLLGLTDIARVHLHKVGMEQREPSTDPDYPSWRRKWVPIAAERDGFSGWFVNTHTGSIGSWTEGSAPEEGKHSSLFAFLQEVADHLEGASSGNARETAANHVRDRRPEDEAIRVWAQTNGCLVNNHGRIPASIREAYEASR